MKNNKKRLRRYVLLGIAGFVLVLGIVLAAKILPVYEKYKESAYDVLQDMDADSFKRAGNTYIYDKDGNLIGQIGNEKYEYVSITDISDNLTNAYIAEEDRRFATHSGVDIRATARAVVALIKNRGEITQGGSTITMQVVKNNLLSQERTYQRKILEMLLARQLEKTYTKAEIMEFYCNSNYFGNNCYGVEGASQYYFGKSAKKLTLAEAAMLAGVSNSPNNYNPVADYDKAVKKKNSVLDHMLECGYITEDECAAAKEENPEIVQKSENVDADNYMVSYAIHYAVLELMEQDGFEFEYTFGSSGDYETYEAEYEKEYQEKSELVRGGGYKLYTSFDTNIQEKLQKAVDENLAEFTSVQDDGKYDMQGAAVCIDNETQMVVAMVGGRGESDAFNRGFLSTRQPGSSIKPLLDYGPAVNEGYVSPASTVEDAPIDVNGYSPKNSGGSYYGNVTVREALARSLNTAALRIFLKTGNETSLSYLDSLEFSSLCYADSTIASIALGGFTNGVKVVDMAKGYATLANQGTYTDNTCLVRMEENDTVVYSSDEAEEKEVYTEDTAFILTDMMQGTFRESYGTAHSADDSNQFYAGKTGTTNDNKDAWFCGYSNYYTTAVWVGCDMPKKVDGLYGSSYPLSIWYDFMEDIHSGLEPSDFEETGQVILENSSGNTKQIEKNGDIYASRPSGYDYVSGILKQKLAENERKARIEKEVEAAETKVEEFEAFNIESVDDAKGVEENYQSVLDVIGQIEDDGRQADLRNRAAAKYELLSGEVLSAWQDLIEQDEAEEQEKAENERIIKAQESKEAALSALHDKRVELVEWYISVLKERTMYTQYIEKLITNAQTALEACSGYSEYESLQNQLSSASTAARNLPTEQEIEQEEQEAEIPEIEEESITHD